MTETYSSVPVELFDSVETALHGADVETEEASLVRIPTTTIQLADGEVQKVVRLIEQLEEHQDVQAVYTTLETSDQAVGAV